MEISEDKKLCQRCKNLLPLSEFRVNKKSNKPDSYCKSCRTEYFREYEKRKYKFKYFQIKRKNKSLKCFKRYIDNLSDWYVKNTIKQQFPYAEITPALINLKKQSIQAYRDKKINDALYLDEIIKQYIN